jgi:SAM-dependent methyltransferase
MVYLQNPVDYEALESDFAWETTYVQERAKRKRSWIKRAAHQVRLISYSLKGDPHDRYLKILGAGAILDIGCGGVVRWRAPFIPHGIEISTVLQKRANAQMRALGGECLHGAGAETIWDFPKGKFDSIMMHSYLEHEVQVNKILDGAMRCLKQGGKAFIRVPNYNALNRYIAGPKWPGFRYPDHVNYFTVKTLAAVAANAGFDFKLVNRHKIWLDDNIQAIFIKPTTP